MVPSRGARGARLGVIEGNEPAQALYRWVGFAEYSEMNLYVLSPTSRIENPTLPDGYEESSLPTFDWPTRYEMDRRMVPASVQAFETVSPGRYREAVGRAGSSPSDRGGSSRTTGR